MSFDYTIYDVTVTPITPLHIGSGTMLLNEFDYATQGNHTWRINEDALLEAQMADDPRLADQLARTPPAQLLKPSDYKAGSRFFRYRLEGTPRATGKGAQLQEQIKTVRDEAYLPGSSLKGAIRTALAWHGWAEMGLRPNSRDLDRRRNFAARDIEKEIMGPNPNHDLLRALHVSDSQPAGKDKFLVLNAQVVTKGSLGSPIELEAIAPDTPFHLTIKVDKALFNQWAKNNRLQLGGNAAWLDQIPSIIQQHTNQRIETELNWFNERSGAKAPAGFYRQIAGAALPATMCILQVGWGTGWSGKTFGSHLQADERFMEHIIDTYRLARGKRQKGDPFPKSRRTTVRVIKDKRGRTQQQPAVPLGWVLMEMKERKQ